MPSVRQSALRALELDDGLSEAHAVLGLTALYYDWDWEVAERELTRALALDETDALARHGYADLVTVLGDPELGLQHVLAGRESDPFSPLASLAVVAHLSFVGRPESVIAGVRNLRVMFPTQARAGQGILATALWDLGRFEEAFEEFQLSWPDDPGLVSAVEAGRAEDGPRGGMLAWAEYRAARFYAGRSNPLDLAHLYARAGETDSAMAWLERAYDDRRPAFLHITAHPDFQALRPLSGFQALVERMGIPTP